MKKRIVCLITMLAVLCSGSVFASAQEVKPGITVQLNGQNLEFTDALPQMKNDRTFLPYRAVFEAMGAQVGYDNGVVTAVRGDTSLTMTIGETTATVTRNGDTQVIYMDAAPYEDSATWRTYVPVRFAADAFGCNVGWDQNNQTVILVDVERLVDEALSGKTFTLLEQYMNFGEKYNEGNWAVNGSINASAAGLFYDEKSFLTGTVSGLVSNQTAGEMSASMDIDMTSLVAYLSAFGGDTISGLGVSEDDLRMSMSMDMKMDLVAGTMYMKFDDASNAQLGLPAGTWLSMDMNEWMAQNGLTWDYDAMMAMSEEMDPLETLKVMLAAIPLDSASGSYAVLSDLLTSTITALSDEGFQKTDAGYETSLTFDLNGALLTTALTLTTDASNQVNGYCMDFAANIPLEEGVALGLGMSASADENGRMEADLSLTLAPLLTFGMTMDMTYTSTTETPNTALPADAVTVDYMDWMMSQLDQ